MYLTWINSSWAPDNRATLAVKKMLVVSPELTCHLLK